MRRSATTKTVVNSEAVTSMRPRNRGDRGAMLKLDRLILRQSAMPQDANRLIWIDIEMTGLKPDTDRDHRGRAGRSPTHALETVAEAPVFVVHQDDAVLDGDGFVEPGDARRARV